MINMLNETFAISGHIHFEKGQGGLTKAVIANQAATAEVYLHGAHVTAFQPGGAEPVLWMSEESIFAPGKAIRGGIPVIWPWFGPHPSDSGKPQHGFARILPWLVLGAEAISDEVTELRLGLTSNAETLAIWPYEFALTVVVTVGATLSVSLTAQNQSSAAIEAGAALHTYFTVGDIGQIRVEGLDGRDYLDKVTGFDRKQQLGPIFFEQEVDRIYLETVDVCTIVDSALQRQIIVGKAGSRSTVVWNPWAERAQNMGDYPNNGYKTMVCVETTNAAEDVRIIEPGASHTLRQTITL